MRTSWHPNRRGGVKRSSSQESQNIIDYPNRNTLLYSDLNHEKCDRINRPGRARNSARNIMLPAIRIVRDVALRTHTVLPQRQPRLLGVVDAFGCDLARRCFPLKVRRVLSFHRGTAVLYFVLINCAGYDMGAPNVFRGLRHLNSSMLRPKITFEIESKRNLMNNVVASELGEYHKPLYSKTNQYNG